MISVTSQAFESAIFDGPVLRFTLSEGSSADELRRAVEEARGVGCKLASARIPADDQMTAELLRGAGFVHVETLVTLGRPCDWVADGECTVVGLARPHEVEACAAIGASAFVHDRFHADIRLDPAAANRLKAEWVANGIRGRADAPLVARQNGAVVGFNLCMRRGEDAAIDLIAVRPDRQGQGYGRALVIGALAHYSGRAKRLLVGTQRSNAASLALYKSLGFVECGRADTFHLVP